MYFDTVWPVGTLERMPPRRDGDRLYGPGTFDMKAGIAIALTAVAALRASGLPHPPIAMLWTTDEEIGSGTSRAIIEAAAREAAAVLVLEPALPGGALKTARKGCGEFELTVHGLAAHAGLDPGKGVSAIHELASQIALVEQLQDLPRGVSVNVGRITGGTRANVVAEEARAVIDVRAPTRAAAARTRRRRSASLQTCSARVRVLPCGGDSIVRRWSARLGLRRCLRRRARWRPHSATAWQKDPPVAAPTGTSRPPSASQPLTAWARSATARTPRTNTSTCRHCHGAPRSSPVSSRGCDDRDVPSKATD